MQTDVCIRIINEKINIKFLVRWVFDVTAIIAFGFRLCQQSSADTQGGGGERESSLDLLKPTWEPF